jgi:hypothetical protein
MSREKKINIAKALSAQLHVTEEAIDTALAEAANLIETYVTSRRAIRMSTIIGNDVHQNTLKAMMALSTAQQHMTAAHANLTLVQEQVGLGNVAILPADDKPAPKPPTGHLVASAEEEVMAAE